MPQSLYLLHSHIIFSTKHRRPVLNNEHRSKLHAYMTGILRNLECYSITIGGVEDHVHIGCVISKKHAPMKVLELVKKDSSKWLKTLSPTFNNFHWQDGYGLFSISPSHVEPLRKYIMNQVEHHKTETFQEEFMRLLKKNNIEYDERYLWD
jgi:REP element-mobilizing transposase RayT